MSAPIFSVIVPVYNSAPYLPSALESLIRSGAASAEFIVVDDGSTDNSYEICRKFADADSRFRIFRKERGGPSSARNYALDRARGEYVTFLDADDRILPSAYKRLAQIIEEKGKPDLVVFGAELFPRGAPDYLRRLVSPRDRTYSEFCPDVLFKEVGARPFLWMQAMKRSIIEDQGLRMSEDISLGEDQLFQMAYIPSIQRSVFVSEKLYAYRWLSPGSIMDRSAKGLKRKVFLHIDLVDRAFLLFTEKGHTDEMMGRLLDFAVSFLYHDLLELRSEDENECAIRLLTVLSSYNAGRYKYYLTPWSEKRYRHIIIMAKEDPDERIAELKRERDRLKSKLDNIKGTAEYKRYERKVKLRGSLPYKVIRSLRYDGVRVTFFKIGRRIGLW